MSVPFFRGESFPYISRRAHCALFPFLVLSCPFQFPFVSLSFPVAFLTCQLPISSPHFLGLPYISPLLPSISRKNTVFPAFSQRGRPKTQSFSRFSAKGSRKPKPAKSRQDNRAWAPCFATAAPRRLRLVERHQITARHVGEPPAPCTPRIRRRAGGGG